MRTLLMLTLLIAISSGTGLAHDFNWDNLLLAKMKLEKGFDYEAHVDAYMQVFRPNVWKQYKNDEFQLEEKRQETIQLMKDRITAFRLEEEFELSATMTLGQYDFEKLNFPVVEATSSHYWYQSRYTSSDFPSSFSAYFNNPELIRDLPMSKEVAKEFLARRKDRYGNVDRKIQVTLRFKIEKLKNERNEFLVEIQSAKFYDDKGRTRLVHQVSSSQQTLSQPIITAKSSGDQQ